MNAYCSKPKKNNFTVKRINFLKCKDECMNITTTAISDTLISSVLIKLKHTNITAVLLYNYIYNIEYRNMWMK